MKAVLLALTLAATGILAATARADGLPVVNVEVGATGVTMPGAEARYVALAVPRGTLVARVQRNGGRVLRSRFVVGRLTIPAVAYDGSASGLSADGRTLVLVRPRQSFPQAVTALAVLDPKRLDVQKRIDLRGDFSFDALSPNGSFLYLIQYVAPDDPTRYVVRAYDLRTGRLLPGAVIDPREPDEKMRGFPATRATSPDGRWAYTLYDGAGSHPFVHALDTIAREAVCIDLHGLAGRTDLFDFRLRVEPGGKTLTVQAPQGPAAVVDTRTFQVRDAPG
jgi:hypothetical protein